MPFRVISPPEEEPLTADDLRERLNLPSSVKEASLDALEKSARLLLERQYGLAFIEQTLEYVTNYFPGYLAGSNLESGFGDYDLSTLRPPRAGCTDIVIPYTPITKINAVRYLDADGVLTTMPSDDYVFTPGELTSRVSLAVNSSWPTTYYSAEAVRVEFVAGFTDDPDELDELFKTAILMNVAHMRSLTTTNLFVTSDSVVGVGQKTYAVGDAPAKAINSAVNMLLQSYIRPSL